MKLSFQFSFRFLSHTPNPFLRFSILLENRSKLVQFKYAALKFVLSIELLIFFINFHIFCIGYSFIYSCNTTIQKLRLLVKQILNLYKVTHHSSFGMKGSLRSLVRNPKGFMLSTNRLIKIHHN